MNKNFVIIAVACLIACVLRFISIPVPTVSEPVNLGAMVAISLFCGSVCRGRWAVLLPLGLRLATDIAIHLKTGYGFFSSWPFDYSAYLLIFLLIGRNVAPHRMTMVVGGSLLAVVTYYLVSNFGVWATTDYYPKTVDGLVSSLIAGIPFSKGTLVGNLVFAPLFYGAWMMITAPESKLTPATADA